jgi:hypothetical protein
MNELTAESDAKGALPCPGGETTGRLVPAIAALTGCLSTD